MNLRAAGIILLLVAMLGGCQSPAPAPYRPTAARFFLETRPGEAGVEVQLPVSGTTIDVGPKPVLLESDLVDAEVVQVDLGRCLMLQFTPAAARDLYRLSVAAFGRRLVLSLNDRFLGAWRIDRAIADGTLLVFVELPDDQLTGLVANLKHTSTTIAFAAPAEKRN